MTQPEKRLYCRHGDDLGVFPADHTVCATCCTAYPSGGRTEHVRTSPSHLAELAERTRDRAVERDLARNAGYLGRR